MQPWKKRRKRRERRDGTHRCQCSVSRCTKGRYCHQHESSRRRREEEEEKRNKKKGGRRRRRRRSRKRTDRYSDDMSCISPPVGRIFGDLDMVEGRADCSLAYSKSRGVAGCIVLREETQKKKRSKSIISSDRSWWIITRTPVLVRSRFARWLAI